MTGIRVTMFDGNTLNSFYRELRRRRVFRAATLYAIVCWTLIQLADTLQPVFEYPDSVVRLLVYGFIGTLPFVLAIAWLYDLGKSGFVRTAYVEGADSGNIAPLLSRTAEALLIAVLLLVVVAAFALRSLLLPTADGTAQDERAPSASTIASLAVLPFVAFGAREDDQVFADGLTEELLNVLSRQTGLRVAARTSSFAYKGVNRNLQQVGRELGVDNIIEGSVRRNDVGQTIRVTAQLVDVKSGSHLWSQTYDREYRDVFRIQDEIAGSVAGELSSTLLGNEPASADGARNIDPQAFMLVSRGRAAMARRTTSAIESAVTLLRQGTEIAPDWGEALADLAQVSALMVAYSIGDRETWLAAAQDAVDRALATDNRLGSAWAVQGLIHMQYDERRPQAIEALRRAIDLNPSYSLAYMWLGSLQKTPQARLELHRKALDLDPRSAIAAGNVANDLLDLGREKEAMEVFSLIVSADPFYPGAYRLVAKLNTMHGRLDDAVIELRRAFELEPEAESALGIAQLYLLLDDTANGASWLQQAESLGADKHPGMVLEWSHALLAIASGDPEQAKTWLKLITQRHDRPVVDNLAASLAYSYLDDYASAVSRFEEAERQAEASGWTLGSTEFAEPYIQAAWSYRKLARADRADPIIAQLREFIEKRLSDSEQVDPKFWYYRACVHVLENQPEAALTLLERAFDGGWMERWRLSVDHLFDGLREDPRFRSILSRQDARLRVMRENLERELGPME